MAEETVSIVIIDDHPAIRHGLAAILKKQKTFEVAGQVKNAEEALEVVAKTKPDIIILDISLGESDGIDLIDGFKKLSPETRIIMYTMHLNKDLIAWSIEAGAHGYLLKSDRTEELVEAVNNVFHGKFHLSSNIPQDVLTDFPQLKKTGVF